jgi:hypothetical protein
MLSQTFEYSVSPDFAQPNNMRKYLSETSGKITAAALSEIKNLEDWQREKDQRRTNLIEMLGLQDHLNTSARETPMMVKKGTIQEEGFRIEKLYYESLPNLFVAANLYVPEGLDEPMPAILYVCGHAHTQKHHYQAHARTLALNGFVCLIIETIQRGEVKGEHLGAESLGWFHWYSKGYNPGGVEVWNGIRGIDLLVSLPEVDTERIGVTGISGGGSQSWYLPAIDGRIKASAAVAGAASLEGQICQRTIDDHCDCMMPINTYGIDFSDIGALIAPRPFLIAQTTGDGYYSIEAVRALYEKIKPIYSHYDRLEHLTMIEAPGGHSYGAHDEFRSKIMAFFLQTLMNKDLGKNDSILIDLSKKWSDEDLKVYIDGAPLTDLTTVIQDSFVKLAKPPKIESIQNFMAYRNEVKNFLTEKTFNAFPEKSVDLAIKIAFRATDFGRHGTEIYSFVSEDGWRLKLSFQRNLSPDKTGPLLVVLRNPDEKRWDANSLASGVQEKMNVAYFDARGIGETGWDPALQWHVRRAAAWTGQTLASMRVYDVLRCLEMVRQIGGVDAEQIYLAAQGEMAAVAPYAALLDGQVKGLILKDPPATQNAASEPSGKGDAIEMLNCLRIADLPQVAGLLFPKQIIILGTQPATYDWIEELYHKLDNQNAFIHLENLSEWNPD